MSLIDRLNENEKGWEELEEIIRNAAIAGGNSAMVYYGMPTAFALGYGAATEADHASTLAIIRSLERPLSRLADKYDFCYSYFGEEFEKLEKEDVDESEKKRIREMLDQLGNTACKVSPKYGDFCSTYGKNHISVEFDPLDGTIPFRAEIPFFCSAIAFFIGEKPVVGAIYNPIHQVVYYASLRGETTSAKVWYVQPCSLLDLKEERERPIGNRGKNKQIAYQITRSKEEKGKHRRKQALDILPGIVENFGNVYMFNAGQIAMAQVARGSLDAYINTYTYTWDIAPGEVLIKAIGGKVTDINGEEIDYEDKNPRISVVAAASKERHNEIMNLLRRC
ncbi:MAG: inositol monophosphatase family protein [bacterium]